MHSILVFVCLSVCLIVSDAVCSVSSILRGTLIGFGPHEKFTADKSKERVDIFSDFGGDVLLSGGRRLQCNAKGKWIKIPMLKGRHHQLYTESVSPEEAYRRCKEEGGVVSRVYTPDHNTLMAMVMEFSGVNVALIGYSDSAREGRWVWDGKEKGPLYTNWRIGQPNDYEGEDYALLTTLEHSYGKWYDIGPPRSKSPLIKDKSGRILREVKLPYWCEIETDDDHFVKSIKLENNSGRKDAGFIHIETEKGQWGGVCHDTFTENSALVVCRMLGFSLGGTYTTIKSIKGTGEILIGDVDCLGNEKSIFDCPHADIDTTECPYQRTVWILCHKNCVAGSFIDKAGICRTCNPGTYSTSNDKQCKLCPKGSYQDETGSTLCKVCGRGYYTSETGQPACRACLPGLYQPAKDKDGCLKCPAGSISTETGMGKCLKCGLGFYQDQPGQTKCQGCPHGKTTEGEGSVSVADCDKKDLTGYTTCGQRHIDPGHVFEDTPKIVGGVAAINGEFPWQVIINKKNFAACGGTIVDQYTILTAAHCVHELARDHVCYAAKSRAQLYDVLHYDKIHLQNEDELQSAVPCSWTAVSDITIEAGVTVRSPEEASRQTRVIEKVYVNERYVYSNGRLHNDIAVVRLKEPLQFTDAVQPACLPTRSQRVVYDQPLRITGFGSERNGEGTSSILRKAIVPFVPNVVCNVLMKNKVSNNMICAGKMEGGKDSCAGDSGGPIGIDQRANRYTPTSRFTLVGVISWGIGCGLRNYYGVYTDLRKFLYFVDDARNGWIDPVASDEDQNEGVEHDDDDADHDHP